MPLHRLRPLTTTLIGGVVFLLPLIVVLAVVGHALQIALQAPDRNDDVLLLGQVVAP